MPHDTLTKMINAIIAADAERLSGVPASPAQRSLRTPHHAETETAARVRLGNREKSVNSRNQKADPLSARLK